MSQKLTKVDRAFAICKTFSEQERRDFNFLMRGYFEHAKLNGTPPEDKPKRGRSAGSKRVPSAEVPGVNAAPAAMEGRSDAA